MPVDRVDAGESTREPTRRTFYPVWGHNMSFRLADSGALALTRGTPGGSSPRLFVRSAGYMLARQQCSVLLIVVEPVDYVADADELAESVIAQLTHAIDACPANDIAGRTTEAFEHVNAMVLAHNRRWPFRRCFLGVTCVISTGRDLIVAHVPPGQLIVRQRHELFAYPAIIPWRLPLPEIDAALARPLGLQQVTEPALLVSSLAAGDLICALTTACVSPLAPYRPALERAGTADEVLTEIGVAIDRAQVRDALVGVVQVGPTGRRMNNRVSPALLHHRKSQTALDRNRQPVQTETAHDGTDWSDPLGPVQAGRPQVMPSDGPEQQTEELPVLPQMNHGSPSAAGAPA